MVEKKTNQSQNNELLYRLDERTADLRREILDLKNEIYELKKFIATEFTTKSEFRPIQKAIYTVATLIITTVVGTLISLVVHKGSVL